MEIEELIPAYSRINELYKELSTNAFGLNEMKELNNYCSTFSDKKDIERAIIKAIGNARFEVLVGRLMNEATENMAFYTRLGNRLEEFLNIKSENVLEFRLLKQEIEEQTEKVNSIYDELKEVNRLLYRVDKDELGQVQMRHDRLDREHKEEQRKLAELYDRKKQMQKTILGFLNAFPDMVEVDKSIIALVKKYLPNENKKDVREHEEESGTKPEESKESNFDAESPGHNPQTTAPTLLQNLRPAQSNSSVIAAIVNILNGYKKTEAERTAVGYCIIALKELGITQTTSDSVLIGAFQSDFFMDNDPAKFKRSIQRVLRSHTNKGNAFIKDKSEQWGDDKEKYFQEVKVKLRIALGQTR